MTIIITIAITAAMTTIITIEITEVTTTMTTTTTTARSSPLQAYKNWLETNNLLEESPLPGMEEFSGDQLFFLNFAQVFFALLLFFVWEFAMCAFSGLVRPHEARGAEEQAQDGRSRARSIQVRSIVVVAAVVIVVVIIVIIIMITHGHGGGYPPPEGDFSYPPSCRLSLFTSLRPFPPS